MASRIVLALLPLLALADPDALDRALSDGYNYNRCDPKGPENWPGDCLLQEQGSKTGGTPINLCDGIAFPGGAPTIDTMGYDTPVPLTVSSDGTSIKVTVANNASRPGLMAGKLSTIVGRSDEDTDYTWYLEQMHLHWGRTGKTDEGSEHFMQGVAYAAEAHFVHYNSKYGNFSNAVAEGIAGNDDALLVVGFFMQPGSTDASVLADMKSKIATISKTETSLGEVDLSDLMGDLSGASYYSYAGGLTTPTCLEIVTWIVIKDVQSITTETLTGLWSLKVDPAGAAGSETISKYGNYRPLQEHGSRKVYSSSGATAACAAVTEPEFLCTGTTDAGFSIVPSLLLPLTIFFTFFASLY